jgi:hypothetical protein
MPPANATSCKSWPGLCSLQEYRTLTACFAIRLPFTGTVFFLLQVDALRTALRQLRAKGAFLLGHRARGLCILLSTRYMHSATPRPSPSRLVAYGNNGVSESWSRSHSSWMLVRSFLLCCHVCTHLTAFCHSFSTTLACTKHRPVQSQKSLCREATSCCRPVCILSTL